MKKLIYIGIAMMAFGNLSAQTDPKTPDQPVTTKPLQDSVTTNQQIQKESDMKTMDAVKTQDHPKVTPQVKNDTVKTKPKKSTRKK